MPRKSQQQRTLERISSMLPSLSIHDLDALIIVANQWRKEKGRNRAETLNSISVVNDQTKGGEEKEGEGDSSLPMQDLSGIEH